MVFTAIDFETAHAQFPCEIGICRVEDDRITDTKSWLIKPACFPFMNHWCQQAHGISVYELKDAPTFEELWSELHPSLEDTLLIAHNAAFDVGVLRAALHYYDLAIPHSDYLCSLSLSRRAWKGLPSYSLDSLCRRYDIRFRHHRAGADAEACAKLVMQINSENGIDSAEQLTTQFGMKLKAL